MEAAIALVVLDDEGVRRGVRRAARDLALDAFLLSTDVDAPVVTPIAVIRESLDPHQIRQHWYGPISDCF